MLTFQILSVLSSAALLVSAAPAFPGKGVDNCCSTAAIKMDLPSNQTLLVSPTTAPRYVALGVGVQNYTCTEATLKYASAGAVASIFDISCLKGTALATIQTTAYKLWAAAPASAKPSSIRAVPTLLGDHYFVPSPSGTGISPKWDFTSAGPNAGNATAFIIAAKAAGIAAPNTAIDVDWLFLNRVSGDLASQVFRIDTVGGQPPSSCVAGSAPISVKYTSKYFLY
ncbi:hypothetical protein C8J57DRAFT_1494596 [Mycena rebaudengoi]|nr:hypothetical protein C8J57DRAFT_1494596 [Mycena rebaudengoi]